MAFATLFTKLCDVDEAVKDSFKFNLSHRNEVRNKQQGPSRKRKLQTEQAGAYLKRQCFQQQSARAFNAGHKHDPRATQGHRTINRTSKDARPGVSSEVAHNHKDKAWCSDHSEGNTNNANKWKTKKKKNKGKKKQENAQRYRNYNKGGRGRNEGIKQPPKRFTQEFIKQHALEVDGRLICIYFLRGKCIKGEECQLEHIEGHNDLIKEVCKFYIQGFCLKGETCPYMHQSFPCKFFHKKGNCRRDDCKFSHDPLNDFTEKLLDDAIKRENELLEHNKKAEEGSLSQPENVSEAVEENTTADIIVQPVRPNFYKSSDTNIEEEALLSDNEQPANITEEDNTEPDNSVPSDINNSGLVCYSVEAVLGRQHYKPFLYTAPGNLESPLSVPKTTTDNILNPANAPYSVNNVRKCKSDFTGNHLRVPPIAQTVVAMCEVKDSDTSETLDDDYKVSQLNNQEKLQENLLKQPPSFHVSAASGYCQKQCENLALKPALSGTERLTESNKTKEGHKSLSNQVPTDKSLTADFKSQYLPLIGHLSSAHNCHMPKQIIKEKSKQSFAIFKDKTATNQATPYHQTLQETNTGPSLDTPQSPSIKNVAGNKQESVLSSNLAASSNKTTTRPFHSLFASLVPDSAQPSIASNSFADKPAVPSGQSIQKSHCDSQKVDCNLKQATKPNNFTENTTKSTNTKETSVRFPAASSETSNSEKLVSTSNSKNIKDATRGHKTSAKSFLSLFAAPLCESITPNKSKVSCSQEPAPSIDGKRSDVKRSNKISSQTSSPENTKTESCYRTEANTNEHKTDMASNVSSNSSNKTIRQTQHQSHNGPPTSVLRTLFQHLRPYEQQEGHWDHVKISVHSERKMGDNNGGCASAVQLKKRGKKHNAKAKAASPLPHTNSTVKSHAPPFHHPTSLQTPDVPLPAHRTPPSPFGPGTLNQKPSSEVKAGNTGASLKDLFKTLHPLKQ